MTPGRAGAAMGGGEAMSPTDFQTIAAEAVTEKQLQEWVRRLSQACGWKFFHPWMAVKSAAGYFDCTMLRAPRIVFAELKTEAGQLSVAQVGWRDEALAIPGAEYYLWRPTDWISGEIERVLR